MKLCENHMEQEMRWLDVDWLEDAIHDREWDLKNLEFEHFAERYLMDETKKLKQTAIEKMKEYIIGMKQSLKMIADKTDVECSKCENHECCSERRKFIE